MDLNRNLTKPADTVLAPENLAMEILITNFIMRKNLIFVAFIFVAWGCKQPATDMPVKVNFNEQWNFFIAPVDAITSEIYKNPDFDDKSWEGVELPHTPRLEPLVVNNQWQGICWYRKHFNLASGYRDKKIFINFEGAMNVAEVWVNGQKMITHLGGYLPFCIDISEVARFDAVNLIAIRLDNRDNTITGPKPLERLDFNMYGGLYRNVWLEVKNPLHITDPILANEPAGGGIFVTFLEVSSKIAKIRVKAHVINQREGEVIFKVEHVLYSGDSIVKKYTSGDYKLSSDQAVHCIDTIALDNPALWSLEYPNLYNLKTRIIFDGRVIDEETTRIGVREIILTKDEFRLNGKKMFLRGVNRHQEYPFIGYAMSDNAQYRDAQKIKEAGFDFVRLSHYPHASAFMDACDELGLLTLDAIPGWQYFGGEAFQKYTLQTCRDMIRRDRNHPSVLAWEVSLNETNMPDEYIRAAHRIAHEEYPANPCFSAGWVNEAYDIYVQARQHRIGHEPEAIGKPYLVSEYGDWEYYAMNAGLNQDNWDGLLEEERSSRQLRSDGEHRLLQQALNIQEAHNDNFNTTAFADAYWVMYDYNRGYADDLESSGIMDIFRIPKFSYYFYKSQRDPDENIRGNESGPMVYIASYWRPDSPKTIRVFSNCEEVNLSLNGRFVSREKPHIDAISNNLNHPPFIFEVDQFEAGNLEAIGYIDNREVAHHVVRTPEEPAKLKIELDESGYSPVSGCNDILFLYITLKDRNGTTVPESGVKVQCAVLGDMEILNTAALHTEAGIATALIKIGQEAGPIKITASSEGLTIDTISFISK